MPSTLQTGFVSHPSCLLHQMGAHHPESPARLQALLDHLEQTGLKEDLDLLAPRRASNAELERAHAAAHVAQVQSACAQGPTALDADTSVVPESWDAASYSAGGTIEAVERVQLEQWSNAFVATRPPGHHAEFDTAMGFCLFNNVSVGARHLLEVHALERIAIIDFDVHHGNGTQHSFERDPRVFYASLHQAPAYPGTGLRSERGIEEGEGATLNVPLPVGSGDAQWMRALESEVLPALDDYAPQFVLLSAGFDAHALDPLAGCMLSQQGYRSLTLGLLDLAARHAAGRLVSVLEGGYHLEALAQSAGVHIECLLQA